MGYFQARLMSRPEERAAQSVLDMDSKKKCITSVARDDLADEGSSVFAQTIR